MPKFIVFLSNRMTGIPLTEERFLTLLESRLNPIKEELSNVKVQIIQLTKFQNLEAKAIEYELRQILRKHLEKHFPLMRINPFSMKEIKHPITGKVITELDGAFTLQQWTPTETNIRRVAEAGLPYMKAPEHAPPPSIFILAEAKHQINSGKITEKLGQFDTIISFFEMAKNCARGKPCPTKFAKIVERNKDITNMEQYILFFGASFWEECLMDDLERDIAERKIMVAKFFELTADRKVGIYRKIRELEKKWYAHKDFPDQLPPDYDLSDSQILVLKEIKGAMNHIHFILPSGERYRVYEDVSEIKPLTTVAIGGHRTRRLKK